MDKKIQIITALLSNPNLVPVWNEDYETMEAFCGQSFEEFSKDYENKNTALLEYTCLCSTMYYNRVANQILENL